MENWLEIQFWRFAKLVIERGYGANCDSKDTEDFPELDTGVLTASRCASCKAHEVMDWIDDHIELLRS